ncbi:MAG: hypothetical protein QNJ34_21715 [Xenococcaceae cyanobacterium MO_188.B29]|nr:hypothetical protein [Xenococcaceae cyanobacterium MO_188.B29]
MFGSFLAVILLKSFIRPYFSHYNIRDFGITGSLPNFFFCFGLPFVSLLVERSSSFKQFKTFCIVSASIGTMYELGQWFDTLGVFDPLDIVASIGGATLTFFFGKRYLFSK